MNQNKSIRMDANAQSISKLKYITQREQTNTKNLFIGLLLHIISEQAQNEDNFNYNDNILLFNCLVRLISSILNWVQYGIKWQKKTWKNRESFIQHYIALYYYVYKSEEINLSLLLSKLHMCIIYIFIIIIILSCRLWWVFFFSRAHSFPKLYFRFTIHICI
jgi:hypothetical protein